MTSSFPATYKDKICLVSSHVPPLCKWIHVLIYHTMIHTHTHLTYIHTFTRMCDRPVVTHQLLPHFLRLLDPLHVAPAQPIISQSHRLVAGLILSNLLLACTSNSAMARPSNWFKSGLVKCLCHPVFHRRYMRAHLHTYMHMRVCIHVFGLCTMHM